MIVTLSNPALKLTLRPDVGARIDDLFDKSGRNWLWHPEGYTPAARHLPPGADFSENWCGGWDDLLAPEPGGYGELWSQSWGVVEYAKRGIKMVLQCAQAPITVEKKVVLEAAAPRLELEYLLKNSSPAEVPYHFKLHPALVIEQGDEIRMPECRIQPVDLAFSGTLGRDEKTPFPYGLAADGSEVRIDRIPGALARTQEHVRATNLSEGSCALRNLSSGMELKITFDLADVPEVLIFQSFGGWKDRYMGMLQPSVRGVLPAGGMKTLRFGLAISQS